MSITVLAVVLLGGCLLMHLLMRKGGHAGDHGHTEDKNKDGKSGKTHSGHGCH